jgi:hypothetical protein
MDIVSHLDLTEIFCDVDDFCQRFEQLRQQVPQLPSMLGEQRSRSRMHLSEVMTIVIAFHGSGAKTFKDFYTLTVLPHWRQAFPHLVSYNRNALVDALVSDAAMLFPAHTQR